jgi:methionyl-tRNA formyltransferase
MRVSVLTSRRHGSAALALNAIATAPGVDLACVVLAGASPPSKTAKRRRLIRKARKALKIGLLGALNGVRIRKWYASGPTPELFEEAERLGVPVVEVSHVNAPQVGETFEAFGVDLAISLGNSYISPSVFTRPRHGMINFHGELLPEYPGALSVVWPIYFGRSKTGFTIHRIDKGIDTGEILARLEYDIPFRPTLRETVVASQNVTRQTMPGALAEVLSNWDAAVAAAKRQTPHPSFTTPTFWQFLKMQRQNRLLYSKAARALDLPPGSQ